MLVTEKVTEIQSKWSWKHLFICPTGQCLC